VQRTLLILTLLAVLSSPRSVPAQENQTPLRKVVNKVVPQYPVLALPSRLSGMVRVEALVSASGKVKSVEIRGGHPLLAQAAAAAVSQWKWEPAGSESRETVEVKFLPPPL
jgi:TonB family protein